MQRQLPVAELYLNQTANSTKTIVDHLNRVINQLNNYLLIKKIYVTKTNVSAIQARGIKITPTLIINGRQLTKTNEIIIALTPPDRAAERFHASPEESFRATAGSTSDDEPDDEVLTSQMIQRRIAEMQGKRPEMAGVDNKISGGRPLPAAKNAPPPSFDDDESFYTASNRDNVAETPIDKYYDSTSGDYELEEYYHNEARSHPSYKPPSVMRRPK